MRSAGILESGSGGRDRETQSAIRSGKDGGVKELQQARAWFLLMEQEVFYQRDEMSNAARAAAYERWLRAVRAFNEARQ